MKLVCSHLVGSGRSLKTGDASEIGSSVNATSHRCSNRRRHAGGIKSARTNAMQSVRSKERACSSWPERPPPPFAQHTDVQTSKHRSLLALTHMPQEPCYSRVPPTSWLSRKPQQQGAAWRCGRKRVPSTRQQPPAGGHAPSSLANVCSHAMPYAWGSTEGRVHALSPAPAPAGAQPHTHIHRHE